MTLQRQLLITVTVLFVCLFIGTFSISSLVTRTYLDKQLTTHARDAATSLGILLTSQMKNNDIATATSIIDAVFDRGYYRSIQFQDIDGKLLVDRSKDLKIYRVPGWFVSLMALRTPVEKAGVDAEWRQAGHVMVQSHPGLAYQELWVSTIIVFFWFLTISLILFTLGVLAIQHLLRPINAIAAQAQAITEGKFPILEDIPKTTQLRKVTLAMNRMTRKLKAIFDDQREQTAKLRHQVYHDPITEVYNRVYFNNHILHHVTLADDQLIGALLLVQIDGLQKYNEINGFLAGDNVVKGIARVLSSIIDGYEDAFVARLTGATFAIVMLHLTQEKLNALAEKICHDLIELAKKEGEEKILIPNVGIAHLEQGMVVTDIIANADMALRAAHEVKEHTFDERNIKAGEVPSEKGWSEILKYILMKKTAELYVQPAYRADQKTLVYKEILLRARDAEGHIRSGGILFPMAERLNMAHKLDRVVLESAVRYLKFANDTSKLALNLTLSSLQDESFIPWLKQLLKPLGQRAQQLIFEIPENTVVGNMESIKKLNEMLAQLGPEIAIDHFGRALSTFAYLLGNRIAYVKIDGSFVRNIHHNEDNQLYIQSLMRVARSIDIEVIAEKVENKDEFDMLVDLGVDGIQGIYTGEIEAVS